MKKVIVVALWLTGAPPLWSPGVHVQAESSARGRFGSEVDLDAGPIFVFRKPVVCSDCGFMPATELLAVRESAAG